MPIEARKGSVLRALVLQEQRALLCPELLQISTTTKTVTTAFNELGKESKASENNINTLRVAFYRC